MNRWWILLVLLPTVAWSQNKDGLDDFCLNLKKLDFDEARQIAFRHRDSLMRLEMYQLADLLFYEGQKDKRHFRLPASNTSEEKDKRISCIRALNAGYFSLFYDQLKGNAFKNFHHAYLLARDAGEDEMLKTTLLALLKYFNLEIAQNSDSYQPYVQQLEGLAQDNFDHTWLSLYKIIFYSKSLEDLSAQQLDPYYFELFKKLDIYQEAMDARSPLLAHINYEKALKAEIENNPREARIYYSKTADNSGDLPFLRDEKFFAFIKLMMIETRDGNFQTAKRYLKLASAATNRADSLRSNYYLNLYTSFFYNAQGKNDSAFTLLKQAYAQDFQLDFRRNTLEINKLTVLLETQEKENQNLKLRQSRMWLASALSGVALLFLASYFAYTNQRSKNRVYVKEREVQSMKLEKLLKDQEVIGIDAMIAGQEKERQRIANDLHDNLGSLLATVKLHFHNFRTRKQATDSTDGAELLEKTDQLLEEAYQKVRGIAHLKNVGVNAQEGLLPAVKRFASKVSIIDKLVIEVEEHGMDKRLENSLEITIFRIIQELITNIIKHANASEAVIHLTQYDNSINIMIEDNGKGFDISKIRPKETMGLYSIQKRIENLGGQVTIESIPQKGTTVIIDVPLV
ncbi:MAG TPA: sensor histidine kinase [Chryseosolibacter sp.]|nr:sensor histidine kinase [Chryseosolibacter sp.]